MCLPCQSVLYAEMLQAVDSLQALKSRFVNKYYCVYVCLSACVQVCEVERTYTHNYVVLFFPIHLKTTVIEKVVTLNPDSWWWMKGDGVDVVNGLWEFVKGECAGDVDLNDGKLQLQKLQNQLHWVEGIDLRNSTESTTDFIHSGK